MIAIFIDAPNPTNWFGSAKLVEYSLRVFINSVFGPNPQDSGLYKQALASGLIPPVKVANWDGVQFMQLIVKEELK